VGELGAAAGAEPELAAAGVGHREHARAEALDDHGPVHRTIGHTHYYARHSSHPAHLGAAAGMTPMQALAASTSVAATACGVGDQVGTIQAGKQADIVILAASPLEDIRAVSRVLVVYKDGEPVR
jgi:imidazolonepropionase-like amidohydrolase